MKITVLGCGSAYGVPYVGNEWGDCDPNNPRNRRTTASILIEKGDTKLLVDMGADYREQSSRHNIKNIDGVLFTHPHADHVQGLYNLPILMAHFQDANLPLITNKFTRTNIEKTFWFMFDPAIKIEYFGPGRPIWEEIQDYQPFQLGDVVALPFPQVHGRMQSLGVRIDDFAYCTDVCTFPDQSFDALRGVKTWIVECNNEFDRGSQSHAYLQKVFDWVEELKPDQTFLTHLEYTMDYDTISKKLPRGIALAYDGLELEVPDLKQSPYKPQTKIKPSKLVR